MYERYLKLLEESNCKTATVAKETGIHPSTFTDWKKGKSSPKVDKLQKIADFFNVNVDWLTGASEYKRGSDEFKCFDDEADLPALRSDIFRLTRGLRIPVLGEVAAGQPIFAEENYIGSEEISESTAKTGEFFGLRIRGDSMSPRISEGDVVIVRQQNDADSGDVVIVLINGDSATCKRLMKHEEGISLISFNPAYAPMVFSNQEVLEKPITIIGKVVENRQKY